MLPRGVVLAPGPKSALLSAVGEQLLPVVLLLPAQRTGDPPGAERQRLACEQTGELAAQ